MNLEAHLPALQIVVPLLSVPVVMLLKPRGFAWAATTAASIVALAIAISLTSAVLGGAEIRYLMGSWSAPYGIELSVDHFSAVLLLVISGASTFALLAGRQSIASQIEAERQPMFFAAWLLALAGLHLYLHLKAAAQEAAAAGDQQQLMMTDPSVLDDDTEGVNSSSSAMQLDVSGSWQGAA